MCIRDSIEAVQIESRSPHDKSTENESGTTLPVDANDLSMEQKATSQMPPVKSLANLFDKSVPRDPTRVPGSWEEKRICRKGGQRKKTAEILMSASPRFS